MLQPSPRKVDFRSNAAVRTVDLRMLLSISVGPMAGQPGLSLPQTWPLVTTPFGPWLKLVTLPSALPVNGSMDWFQLSKFSRMNRLLKSTSQLSVGFSWKPRVPVSRLRFCWNHAELTSSGTCAFGFSEPLAMPAATAGLDAHLETGL